MQLYDLLKSKFSLNLPVKSQDLFKNFLLKRRKILVIGTDIVITQTICQFLVRAAFDPVPAYSVELAKEKLGAEEIDALLLDISYPDALGFVAWYKEQYPKGPAVIFSSDDTVQADVKCNSLKPIGSYMEMCNLVAAIRRAFVLAPA